MGRIAFAPGSFDAVSAGESAPAPFDADTFRRALGRFATGVTLITAVDASGPLGLIVNAFTSVSLEPPLIAVCPSRRSFTWSRMRRRGRFGVNVLGAEHADYVRHAADPDADRFAGIDHTVTESGVPRIGSAIAFLDCEPVAEHLAGDHWIVVARVHDLLADHRRGPLVFSDGTIGSFVGFGRNSHERQARSPRPVGDHRQP